MGSDILISTVDKIPDAERAEIQLQVIRRLPASLTDR